MQQQLQLMKTCLCFIITQLKMQRLANICLHKFLKCAIPLLVSHLCSSFWLRRFELHTRVVLRKIKFRSEYDIVEYLLHVHNFNVNVMLVRVIHFTRTNHYAIFFSAELKDNKFKQHCIYILIYF